MSAYEEDELPFLCSKSYDPTQDSPQKFASAWGLLVKKHNDLQRQIEHSSHRLQNLKTENNPSPAALSFSSTNPYALLARPASSKPSPTTVSKSSRARMPTKPQLRKRPVDGLVHEIQGKQDELKRVQHDVDTEEGRRLKKSSATAGASDGWEAPR